MIINSGILHFRIVSDSITSQYSLLLSPTMLNFTGSYSDPQNSLSLRFRRDCQVSKYSLWLSILTVSKAKPGQTTTYIKTNNRIMISLSIAVVLLDITWSFKWWFDYFGRKFSDCSLIRHTVDQTLWTTKQTNYPRRHPADKQEDFRTERWCHFQEMYIIFSVVLFRPWHS